MASHYKWYPGSEEVVVPWNARYSFPSQANKALKLTPRIPPKNGSIFTPGQVIRVEFPAQGYVNASNTTLEFDVTLSAYGTAGNDITRFQNNIQSIFNRVRLLYGATPLEDIINYNVIVRSLTEWTGTGQQGLMDQESIADGIGGVTVGLGGGATSSYVMGLANVRQKFIQGIDNSAQTAPAAFLGSGFATVPNTFAANGATVNLAASTCTRRYSVNLALGLFTQDKLIPTKFMASQLAIEITLENADYALITFPGTASGANPTYTVTNVNLIPEILEFDASYDAMFLRGLREGGVPIKFSSWHTFIFSTGLAANINLLVQERSRSVKALFCVQRRSPGSRFTDSHATIFDSAAYLAGGSTMQSYQWRIGGRYFPAAPVQLSNVVGGTVCNGGAEAYVELEKALNIVGDYRLSTGLNAMKWAVPAATATITPTGGLATALPELDYFAGVTAWTSGAPSYLAVTAARATTNGNCFSGEVGSSAYASAVSLETSNGIEISGLNAEEQSDIAFIANWSQAQLAFNLEVYSYYDAMIILRENNVLELIQ